MKIVLTLVALTLLAVGPVALLAPDVAAAAFGIAASTPEARAYLLAAAARDSALGLILLALLGLGAGRRVLAAVVLGTALIGACDALNYVTYMAWRGGPALIVHVGGLVVLLVVGAWLWLQESR